MRFMRSVGLLAAVVLACTMVSSLASAASRPALRAVRMDPLTVRGLEFRPHERVIVKATVDAQTRVRRVATGPAGGFLVRFGDLSVDRCSGFVVVAVAGDRRVALKAPTPLCPPTLAPAR
jgi:hypothetical protein